MERGNIFPKALPRHRKLLNDNTHSHTLGCNSDSSLVASARSVSSGLSTVPVWVQGLKALPRRLFPGTRAPTQLLNCILSDIARWVERCTITFHWTRPPSSCAVLRSLEQRVLGALSQMAADSTLIFYFAIPVFPACQALKMLKCLTFSGRREDGKHFINQWFVASSSVNSVAIESAWVYVRVWTINIRI